MDSPDQGAKGIAIDAVTRQGDDIKAEARKIGGVLEGRLGPDGLQIKGQWKQGGQSYPLTLARLEKEPDYRRPQEPDKPYPYREEEVTYMNGTDNVKLAGTLTLPPADRPVPAVILLTGSGAQDRDETILGHKPFLILADALTRQGIAVLRVDDRGVGGSTGDPNKATTADLVGDALAGVAYLKGRKEIDARHIGLVGHSEGGMIAPLAATRSGDVAFIVLLAGTGVTGEEILYRQGELIARAQKAGEKQIASARQLQAKLFEIIRQDLDPAAAAEKLHEVADEAAASTDVPATQQAIRAQLDAQSKMMLTPWFRYFLTYDPAVALRKVHCPVLALNGQLDLQVDPQQNLPPISAALKQAGNRDVTVRELPGLNHLFQHCQTGSPTEYGKIDETMSPEVLQIVGDWIVARAK